MGSSWARRAGSSRSGSVVLRRRPSRCRHPSRGRTPISTSWACRATTSISISLESTARRGGDRCEVGRRSRRACRRLARARSGAPRARDLNEAREFAGQILEPQHVTLPESARPTLERFRELVNDDAHATVRELKAVGGDLKALRLALTGGERGPGALDDPPCAIPRRGIAEGRCCSIAPSRNQRGAACPSRTHPYVRLRADRLPADPRRQRPAVRDLDVAAALARAHGYDVTLVENITDVNDKIYDARRGGRAQSSRVRRRRGTSPTPTISAWVAQITNLGPTETIPEQIALDRRARRPWARVPDRRGCLLSRHALRRVRRSLEQRPDELEEQEPNPSKEDPRDFAL